MKKNLYLTLVVSMTLTTGCASIERSMHSDHLSSQEREQAKDKKQQELQAQQERERLTREQIQKDTEKRRAYFNSLKPDMTFDEITVNVGKPALTDFTQGFYRRYYNDQISPMILSFDTQGKLKSWELDRTLLGFRGEKEREALQRDEDNKKEARERADRAESDRRQRIGMALMYMGSVQSVNQATAPQVQQPNRPINCTSQKYGTQTITNCN